MKIILNCFWNLRHHGKYFIKYLRLRYTYYFFYYALVLVIYFFMKYVIFIPFIQFHCKLIFNITSIDATSQRLFIIHKSTFFLFLSLSFKLSGSNHCNRTYLLFSFLQHETFLLQFCGSIPNFPWISNFFTYFSGTHS